MKSRLFVSLLTALFIVGNVFAGTPLEDELVLMGEFSQIGSRSVKPELPISATFEGNVLYVEFTAPVGNVGIAIKDATQNVVYTSSMDVTAFGQQVAISVENYQAGTYIIEFRNSKDGYVYGEFTLM
ncbi:DUF3244 domain-containing protein [Bacteroides salyersiae]|uniref:DUF3244 domain-containing protein n=1 Tax=Bacteroides salyersiae TaxID=291644 RepID=UPI001C8C7E14|nr:DUF3244 domain-containing protein [Bacteroides salyersiae]